MHAIMMITHTTPPCMTSTPLSFMCTVVARVGRFNVVYPRDSASFLMARSQWTELAEMEAVLTTVRFHTTIVQTEKTPMAAFAHEIRSNLLRQLRSENLAVVDLPNVAKERTLPRIQFPVLQLTALGRTCLLRAQLEAERRFCRNEGTELTSISGAPAVFELWQQLPVLLDPRTLGLAGA